MSISPKFKELVRVASTQFKLLNRNKSLSRADKKQLKTFFLDRMIGPQVRHVLAQNTNGHAVPASQPPERMAGQRLLTAREAEAWLQIDAKTLYKYANEGLIPHVRLKTNVRFPARELQRWVRRHFHLPPGMKASGYGMRSLQRPRRAPTSRPLTRGLFNFLGQAAPPSLREPPDLAR